MRRHVLLVLGMRRSGTAELTAVIAKAHAHPGANLMPATYNPDGYGKTSARVDFNAAA